VEEMGKVSPENKTYFETNGEDFKTDLTKLDEEMALTIFNFKSKDIITFHEGFNYLAGDYGLNVIGSIEPVTGTEPTAEQIQQITDQIKNLQVKAVFSEPQLSSKVIESLRNDLGIEVGILDPLGGLGGRMTYVALMKYNLLELKRFLE